MKLIIACRHGESYKNLKDISGGNGLVLTENGKSQVEKLVSDLKMIQDEFNCPVSIFRSCDRVQIVQTAEMIKDYLKLDEVKTDKKFCPIRLGVFDGLSKKEREEKYPDACKVHEMWKNGIVDISESEKLIPGTQRAIDYYDQVKSFIQNLPENQIYILVGTRSDLSCLKNIMKNQRPDKLFQYKCYSSAYCEKVMAITDENGKFQSLDFKKIFEKNSKIEKVENVQNTENGEFEK